jgi:hypothetical protein
MVEELHPPGIKNIKLALLGIIFDRVCTFPVWTFTVMKKVYQNSDSVSNLELSVPDVY